MLLRFAILIALAAAAFGATSRLYLKDGDYQIVREYQVLALTRAMPRTASASSADDQRVQFAPSSVER